MGSKKSVVRQFTWIGTAGGFAVFPDIGTSRQAMIALLRTSSYQDKNIRKLVERYAPYGDNNDVNAYVRLLQTQTGVYDNRKIRDFTQTEFQGLCRGIEKMECYREGTITTAHKVLHVKENSKGIYAFDVEELRWLCKGECIKLARKGKIDAVVCKSRSGHLYLRSRPHKNSGQSFHDLAIKEK